VDGEPLRETSIVALSMSSAYFQLYDHRMGARTGSLVVALTLIGLALTLIWIDRTGPRKPRLVWSAGPYVLALPAVALEPVYAPIVATAAGLGLFYLHDWLYVRPLLRRSVERGRDDTSIG
jgi:hypothetical protein